MNDNQQRENRPKVDRETLFASVDRSNARFDHYSKTDRQTFAAEARAVKSGVQLVNETRRAGH